MSSAPACSAPIFMDKPGNNVPAKNISHHDDPDSGDLQPSEMTVKHTCRVVLSLSRQLVPGTSHAPETKNPA